MQALLDRIIANPERCESIASGKDLYEIAKNLLGLKVTKSMSKGDLCKAIKRAVQSAPVQSAPIRNMEFEEKREIEEKVDPMTTAIRKQVLGQDLYDMCLEQGGRVEREQLSWRLKQLQDEGLFTGCSEEDLVRVCDFKTEPSSGCAKHLFERVREDKYTDFNTCAICADMEDEESLLPSRTPCGHMVHGSCLLRATNRSGIGLCPFCRTQLKVEKQGRKFLISFYEGEVRRVVHHRDDLERDAIEAAMEGVGIQDFDEDEPIFDDDDEEEEEDEEDDWEEPDFSNMSADDRSKARNFWIDTQYLRERLNQYYHQFQQEVGLPIWVSYADRHGVALPYDFTKTPSEISRLLNIPFANYRSRDIFLMINELRPRDILDTRENNFWRDIAQIVGIARYLFSYPDFTVGDEHKKELIRFMIGMAYFIGTATDVVEVIRKLSRRYDILTRQVLVSMDRGEPVPRHSFGRTRPDSPGGPYPDSFLRLLPNFLDS